MKHEMGWARVRGVAKRRRWPVILTALCVTAAGLFAVKSMDPVYEARTVVRINDPRPSREYVAPMLNEPDGERLKSARLGFLAQPVVATAADAVNMLPKEEGPARARELALITQRVDARQEGQDTFVVTFEDRDPLRARAFVHALADAHAAQRTGEMTERASATAAFLQAEVENIRPRLADAEARLEKFRLEHYGALPDQLEANLRFLNENEMTMHSLTASLDSAYGRRREVMNDVISPLRQQEEAVARELSAARTRFAAGAPEVKALEAELSRVREDRLSDEGAAAKRVQSSRELKNVEAHIARIEGQVGALRKRSEELRGRIEGVARNGEQIARMALDRDVLRDRFKSLMQKHEEAALAAGLEASVSGKSRLTVLEPAWASAQPVKPSKPLYAMLVVALAALLALAVGFVIDTLDRRVLAADDVRALVGDLPILAVVPRLSRAARAANSNDVRAAIAAGRDR